MKKELKTQITREKIIEAALPEFAEKGYEGFVINELCKRHHISKGVLYHNFSGKSDLYIACVGQSLQKAIGFLRRDQEGIPELEEYMRRRRQFFEEYPSHSRLFFEALICAPEDIQSDEIQRERQSFIDFNIRVCEKLLKGSRLKKNLNEREAMKYLILIQELFRGYFYSISARSGSRRELSEQYEATLSHVLQWMLYGILEEPAGDYGKIS